MSLFPPKQTVDQGDVKYSPSGDAIYNFVSATVPNLGAVTKEPTGFVDRIASSVSFSDISRTFSIQPASGSYDFYIKGNKFTKTGTDSVTIPNSDGANYIYFDASGNLTSTQSFTTSIFTDNAIVSIVYWNTSTSSRVYWAEERHGLTMDGATHTYLHTVFGARFISGFALQNFSVDGNGNSNAHAQFTSDSGSIRDEDILIQGLAQSQIPILYKIGTVWAKKAADSYPVIYSGTAGFTGANGLLAYNQLVGGSWQLTEVPNTQFVLVNFFATNDIDNPVVGIQGINIYNSISAARNGANVEITSLSGLPFAEFVPIGSVIFQTASSYTNAPKARVRSTDIGGNYVDFRGTQLYTPAAGNATSHSLLSNLSNDDHLQYLLVSGTRAMSGILDMGTNKISNVVDPSSAQDVATKNYVDTSISNKADQNLGNLTSPTAINQVLLGQDGTEANPAYSFTSSTGTGSYKTVNPLGLSGTGYNISVAGNRIVTFTSSNGTFFSGGIYTSGISGGFPYTQISLDNVNNTSVNGPLQHNDGSAESVSLPMSRSHLGYSRLSYGNVWARFSGIHALGKLSAGWSPDAQFSVSPASLYVRPRNYNQAGGGALFQTADSGTTLNVTWNANPNNIAPSAGIGDFLESTGSPGTRAKITGFTAQNIVTVDTALNAGTLTVIPNIAIFSKEDGSEVLVLDPDGNTKLSGNLLFTSDSSNTIGVAGANRPGKGYFAYGLQVGGSTDKLTSGNDSSIWTIADSAVAIDPRIGGERYSASSNAQQRFSLRRSRGTLASPSAVNSGDSLGRFTWSGMGDAGSFRDSAQIIVKAFDNFTNSSSPGYIQFQVTPLNSTSLATALQINSDSTIQVLYGIQIGGAAGTSTAFSANQEGSLYLISSNTSAQPRIEPRYYADNTNGFRFSFRKSRGNEASPAQAISGDELGRITLSGMGDAGSFRDSARILAFAAENITNTSSAGYLRFDTTPSGSTTPTERIRITASGDVGIGTSTPAQKLDVNGTVQATDVQVPNYILSPQLYNAGTKAADFALDLGTNGPCQQVTINVGGPLTITLNNPVTGGAYLLKIVQGATTGTINFAAGSFANVKFGAVGPPTLSSVTGKIDIINLYYDGTNYYGTYALGF